MDYGCAVVVAGRCAYEQSAPLAQLDHLAQKRSEPEYADTPGSGRVYYDQRLSPLGLGGLSYTSSGADKTARV